MKRFLWTMLSVLLLAGMGYSIVGLVTRGAPTLPRAPDAALAERVIVAPAGTPEAHAGDFRDMTLLGAGDDVIGASGVVEPDHAETRVSGEVAGRVASVSVVEGQRVEVGALLLTLEDASERAALAVAEAELEVAQVQRDRLKLGSRAEAIREAIARAREAKSRAALSRGVLERTERLAADGAATGDELDRAKRQAEADAFAGAAADAAKSAVVNGSRAEDVAEADARVRVSEARISEARARLEQRRVRAPLAGEVLQVRVRAGEYLQPGGEAPIVIGDTSRLTVRLDVDERDYARVVVGAAARITAKAFGDRVMRGTVRELGRRMGRKNLRTDDPTERNDTKILEVVIALDDFDGLVVGQRVTALVDATSTWSTW